MKLVTQKAYFAPEEVLTVGNILRNIPEAVIAGGAARSVHTKEEVNDVDVFLVGCSDFKERKEMAISALKANAELVFQCPEGLLYSFRTESGLKIQLISKRNYSDVSDLFQSFDFTLCQFAFLHSDCSSIWNQDAAQDVTQKELKINKITYPVASLKRMSKYISYGYKPSQDFYLQMFTELHQFLITDDSDLALYID
ncbi:hypothetical protein [Marinicella marina]|uniref:hypothetical protein n=1 Tax=Marinicella marina TaxID=2996016 RepID=UPI0024BCC0FC|nr:hypothetical protein [Marinicella marina]MDJ1139647.1 hypothetical protein [Marinicella marina]